MRLADLPGARMPGVINAIGYAADPLGYTRWFARRYGPVVTPRFLGFGQVISIADPELVRQVFTGDPEVVRSGESSRIVLEPTLGAHSLLTLDGAAHLRHRKLLLEPFHGENVQRWEEQIRSITEQDLRSWPVAKPFSLHEHTRAITLEVILRAVFGVREQARFERGRALVSEFAQRAHPITLFTFLRRDLGPRGPWARFQRVRDALDALLYEEIDRRREQPDLSDRDDVLSMLLRARDESGKPLSRQELRDELVTVLGAGHETTAIALAWTFERLLRTPVVLERLVRSLPDGDDYLQATVKEILRIRPVVTDVSRMLSREVELGGIKIPAGVRVMPALAAIHFRPDLYPDPDEFRPERFLEGAPEPYTWVPFGGGVRRCIGATFAQFEMRVIIRTILERARLRAVGSRPERSRLRNVTAAPSRGCRVILEGWRAPAVSTRRSQPVVKVSSRPR